MTRLQESVKIPGQDEKASGQANPAIARCYEAFELSNICVSGMDPMMEAKLWRNPCWFAFRINYIGLRYNQPLYEWVRRNYGLSRPEYVVIYSLGISGGGQASHITHSSGQPKNTLSRAVTRLEAEGLIVRNQILGKGRNQHLELSKDGQALFDETLPAFVEHERKLLSGLSEDERATLSRLLAKVALNSHDWPSEIPDNPAAVAK